jgi:beta-galactosidase
VEGEGRVIGVGNGDPSSHEPDRVFARVTTLPFKDFRENDAPPGEEPREVRAEFDASRWKPAFASSGKGARIYRGTLTSRRLAKGAPIRLLLRHFGASTVVYLNGRKLASFAMTRDAPLPSIDLSSDSLRDGSNMLAVIATPYENDRARERATKVPPAVLRVETPEPPWSRRFFNGLAQLIVQSKGAAGTIRIKATSPGLVPAELTVAAQAPASSAR